MATNLEQIKQPIPTGDISTIERMTETLDRAERLCEMLAVDDGYEPATRDYVLPRGFKVSIVIPVYNEERTIATVLARVAALPVPKEIIVIDDCSTDGTRQILEPLEAARDIHVIFKPINEGKGAALRTGFRRATGNVVVVQDADLEYDPRDIVQLIKPLVLGKADVVYGSRFLYLPADAGSAGASRIHRLGNRLLTKLSNLLTGLRVTDMETCYKAFRRDVLQSFEIKQNRFGFEPEVTARIARRKYSIAEVPIRYTPRGYAEGKKIGLADLFNALYCILRYGLSD